MIHPKVADVAVFGIPDDEWGEQIKAVVEPAEGVPPGPELTAEILASLDGRLARMKWPKSIDYIETHAARAQREAPQAPPARPVLEGPRCRQCWSCCPPSTSLEFPGGYTRSVGPVIGRFLTELRDGRLVGVRTAAGRRSVPPRGVRRRRRRRSPGSSSTSARECTVGTYAWVSRPRPDHPLDRPFAWALLTPGRRRHRDAARPGPRRLRGRGQAAEDAARRAARPAEVAGRSAPARSTTSSASGPDVTMIDAPVRAGLPADAPATPSAASSAASPRGASSATGAGSAARSTCR